MPPLQGSEELALTGPASTDSKEPPVSSGPPPALVGRVGKPSQTTSSNATLLKSLTGFSADCCPEGTYSLRPALPLAGRLTHFLQFWKAITTDQWVLQIIEFGYRLDFAGSPPSSGVRVTTLRGDSQSVLMEEVEGLLEKCAIELVPPGQEKDGFYSTYFVVPKKDGGIRPILNLKLFNQWLVAETFKMETLSSILIASRRGTWIVSIDLKDAYFHVPILRAHWKYLRFSLQGRCYQYRVTPFGLSAAPRLFTRVVSTLVGWLRSRGVQLHAYLDDILIVGWSPQETVQALRTTIQVFTEAGFTINLKKSDLTPSQDMVYIGGRFRTDLGMVFLPEDRLQALVRAVSSFARVGCYHPARLWLQILGLMAACISVVQNARLHMRPVQWHLKTHWNAKDPLTKKVMVTSESLTALRWWMDPANLSRGKPFQDPPPELVVTTDASTEGWGGHSLLEGEHKLFSGLWSQKERRLCHINLLELRAIKLTLLRLAPYLTGRVVKLECDNTTAVNYVNKQGGTRSATLCREAVELHHWLFDRDISVVAVHRPGVNNELADFLSRNRPDPTEWSLHPAIANRLFTRWGRPQLDLFASPLNNKLPLWYSRVEDAAAVGTNALAHRWTGWYVYAYPPINLIPRVLTKIQQDEVEAIVVLPDWPRRGWFNLLLPMAVEQPVKLPIQMDLLSQRLQDKGVLYHPDLQMLQLTAWKLNGSRGNARASPAQLPPQPWRPSASQLARSMTLDGQGLSTGAMAGTSSLYTHL